MEGKNQIISKNVKLVDNITIDVLQNSSNDR
jgi:hypothetical protein